MNQPDVNVANTIIDNYQYNYAYDGSNNLEYLGKAMPGAADDDSAWSIVKFSYTGSNLTAKKLASNNASFNKQWTQRAMYF